MPISFLLRILALGFLGGVFARSALFAVRIAAQYPEGPLFPAALFLFMLIAGVLLCIRRFHLALLLATAFLFGFFRLDVSIRFPPRLPPSPVELTGIVRLAPIITDTSDGWNVLVDLPSLEAFGRGSMVRVRCRLRQQGSWSQRLRGFSFAPVLRAIRRHEKGTCVPIEMTVISSAPLADRLRDLPRRTRHRLATAAGDLLPMQSATLLRSIVLGIDENVSREMTDAFRRTGTLHLLVVSGSHFALLARYLETLLTWLRFRRRQRAALISLFLGFFLLVIGAPASAIRGYLASLSVVVAGVLDRPRSAVHLLGLIAAGMVLFDPWLLVFDLGFQLSVLASLGVIVLSLPIDERLARLFHWVRLPSVRASTASTLAALCATVPLLLWFAGELSLVAPLANVPAVLLSPMLLNVGLVFLALASLSLLLARLIAPAVAFLFEGFALLIAAFADAPLASLTLGSIPLSFVVAYYVFFLVLCWRLVFSSYHCHFPVPVVH